MDHVHALNELISSCKNKGHIVVVGDWNCQFSHEYGSRFDGATTLNSTVMAECIYSNAALWEALCEGPRYTFSVVGVGQSYIDHIAVSYELTGCITYCAVLQNCLKTHPTICQ